MIAHVAGAGRGSFNHRFAQPSRDGHPFLNKLYPSDIFPFTDVTQHDPETDMRDGLLAGIQPGHMPKVFYTNSSYEYWGRAASLIHTTLDGTDDAPLLDNVRIYSFAGGQHGPGRFPPQRTIGQQPSNPNDYSWFLRPLLLAMERWTADETAMPPPSVYPRVADGDLIAGNSDSRSCRTSDSRPSRTSPTAPCTARSSGPAASRRCSRRRCSRRFRSWCPR